MKKIIAFAVTALLCIPFAASAQKTTVTRINRENAYRTTQTTVVPRVRTPREKLIWYQGEVDLGLAIGNGMTGPIVETVHGIHISKYAFVGAGLGLHYPIDYGDPLVPMFVDLKFSYPITDKIAPFLSVDAGYDVCEDGAYFSVGAGLKYKRWQFSAGVRGTEIWSYSDYYYEDSSILCCGFLKVGFTF